MDIHFTPLATSHFQLMLKWLETPHVKAWWNKEIKWTPALIEQKYTDYVKGYKLENGIPKPMHAHIICVDNIPIGYIQIYNAYDFARSKPLTGLPKNLGAFDILIGEPEYLNRGIGSRAIMEFLEKYGATYTHIFVDPESANSVAIHTYKKAGFEKIQLPPDNTETWMIRKQ